MQMPQPQGLAAVGGARARRCLGWGVAAVWLALSALPSPATSGEGSSSAAAYWPKWRGPDMTGVAPMADPPIEWSPTKNIQWKVALPGSGTSTPIVWGERIFVTSAIPTGKKVATDEEGEEAAPTEEAAEGRRGGRGGPRPRSTTPDEVYQFVLICLDRATGDLLWQQVAREEVPHEGHHADHGFASHSAVTDGQVVFAYFGSRGLHCYTLDGEKLWERDLGKMQTRNSFGEGSSPALHRDTVVITWDHEADDFIVALDRTTGDELWRQPRDEPTTWATPLVVQHDGRDQVVTAGTERVRSYDLKTGELVWECEGLTVNAIPSPVAAGDMVYVMSGFRGSVLRAIRLGHTGDLTDTEAIVWTHGRSTPYVPSPLLYDNRLYFYAGNNAILSCFDVESGQPLFGPARLDGLQGVYASPLGASGRIYLVGRNGTTLVARHADELEILATNVLDEEVDASPVAVGRQLLLRGHRHLYCIAQE